MFFSQIFSCCYEEMKLKFMLLLFMPCHVTVPKMFFCRSTFFVSDQKFFHKLCKSQTFCARQKDDLHSVKIVFCTSTKVFKEALNVVKFWDWLKKFVPAQNILGPVKGRGISY